MTTEPRDGRYTIENERFGTGFSQQPGERKLALIEALRGRSASDDERLVN